MSRRFQRAVAGLLCGGLRSIAPGNLRGWADAVRAEMAGIPDDGDALRFAWGSFCGLLPRVLIAQCRAAFASAAPDNNRPGEPDSMILSRKSFRGPRLAGVICAAAAVLLGPAYMAAAGAPLVYLVVNLSALVIGIGMLAVATRITPVSSGWAGAGMLAMAGVLLATALFGRSAEGAARWVALGPVFLQTSLVFLPVMVTGFARMRTAATTIALCVAALALALQPDRAMAGVLAAGLTALALFRFDRYAGAALAGALLGFVFTLMTPDTLPAVQYVDRILYSAFEVHLLAGLAVLAGTVMLLVPAIEGWRTHAAGRMPAVVFGAVWLAVIFAAALGNYPTPVVGYGSSAIIGYLLSLSVLPASPQPSEAKAKGADERTGPRPGRLLRVQVLSAAGLLISGMGGSVGEAAPDECARPEVDKVEIPGTVWQPGPEGEQIPLWPEDTKITLPDYKGNPEMTGTGSPLIAGRTWSWATYVSRPTMTVYAPKGGNTGAALLVLPGGGYAAVAMDLEGTEICDWITTHGVTCILLKYRAPQVWQRDETGAAHPPEDLLPLEDAQRAMSLLRAGAASRGIDPAKIGVIGFSAGAHLAAAISNADERTYARVDAADDQPMRPDFAMVLYPGRFLPAKRSDTDLSLVPWMEISAGAPPTLLIHAMNDPVNDVRHSIAYGLALNDLGVPVDMRFFSRGCHAFGLRPTSEPVTTEWPAHAVQWLHDIGIL